MSASSDEPGLPVYALRFTPRARADIDAAYARFVELSGEGIADEWQAGLFDVVTTLATTPRRLPMAPESTRFRQEIRQLVYRRRPGAVAYRVLFTIVETQGDAPTVRILHVRHGAARPVTRTGLGTLRHNSESSFKVARRRSSLTRTGATGWTDLGGNLIEQSGE